MAIAKKDLPAYVRRCYTSAIKANRVNREAEIERLKFYVGGDLQWRPEELTRRRNQGRPWVTINKCKPAVDQIEGDIRLNPPGPEVFPVGGGADTDTADILAGLIRETEFRSDARVAYSTAGKYAGATGCAYIELMTEYVSDRSFAQQLVIKSIEDPATVFFDPAARMANRQDAMWCGKMTMYSKDAYIAKFGKGRRALQPSVTQSAMGWIQDALGVGGVMSEVNEWTGAGEGPFFVCEFTYVDVDRVKLRACSDHIARFEDEDLPGGVKFLSGEENVRMVGKRTIKKATVDAFETLEETDWLGTLLPLIPILGPEVYIEGKLHRLSLISGAIDSQRGLNYTATTMTELAGMMPKSPWIGWEGQFDNEAWKTANSEVWAYLEVKPVYGTDENGAQTLLPAPQRNMWEAPIQWLLALKASFSDDIKAVTNIYDPSLGAQKGDQSGKAIEQLRSESNVGNYSYADNLHRGIGVLYQQCIVIFPQILDGPRVQTIVRADNQHEIVRINEMFDGSEASGNKSKDITRGFYGARATAGPSFESRQKEAASLLADFFKAVPQTLAVPGVASGYLRLIGDKNAKVQDIADKLDPQTGEDGQPSPEQLQAQLGQAKTTIQSLTQLVQQLHQKLEAGLPKIEADKWKTLVDNATKVRIAQITASKDLDRMAGTNEASLLEHMAGLAHEAASQAVDHEHEASQQQAQQAAAAQAQASDQGHQAAAQASDQAHASQSQQSDQQAAAAQQEAAANQSEE